MKGHKNMKKKAIAALTVAGLMALQLPMTAFADTIWNVSDTDKTRTGNLIVTDSWAAVNFSDVSNINAGIDGYIQHDTSESGFIYGVFSSYESSENNSLHIKGNKDGDSVIVNSTNNGSCTSDYTVAVCAQNTTSFQIDGDIRITENGAVNVYGADTESEGASITAGDVYVIYDNATGAGTAYGLYTSTGSLNVGDVYAANNAVVDIESCVSLPDSYGAFSYGGTIEADSITATAQCGNAIAVYVEDADSAVNVTVLGDIAAESAQYGENFASDGIRVQGAEADVTVRVQKITAVSKNPDGGANGIVVNTFMSDKNKKIDIECSGIELETNDSAIGVISTAEGTGSENDIRVNGDILGNMNIGVLLETNEGRNSVTVDGNIDASEAGILVAAESGLSTVAVNGTVSGDNCALYVEALEDDCSVSVYGLKTSETGMLANDEAVLASVNYIVHGNDGSADYNLHSRDTSRA